MRIGSGGRKASHTIDLHKTGTARADGFHVRVLAQLGNIRPRMVYSVQNRRALVDLYFAVVDLNGYRHFDYLLPMLLIP